MELVLKKLNQGLEVEGICTFRSKMTTRNTVTGIFVLVSLALLYLGVTTWKGKGEGLPDGAAMHQAVTEETHTGPAGRIYLQEQQERTYLQEQQERKLILKICLNIEKQLWE